MWTLGQPLRRAPGCIRPRRKHHHHRNTHLRRPVAIPHKAAMEVKVAMVQVRFISLRLLIRSDLRLAHLDRSSSATSPAHEGYGQGPYNQGPGGWQQGPPQGNWQPQGGYPQGQGSGGYGGGYGVCNRSHPFTSIPTGMLLTKIHARRDR
jgi:hypothetical protein